MNKISKRIISFALAALLVFGMVVTSAAALEDPFPTVTVSNVEENDTVAAYQLIAYEDTEYNKYKFDADFERYLTTVKAADYPDDTAEQYLARLSKEEVADLLGYYAAKCNETPAAGTPREYNLPTPAQTLNADATKTVTLANLVPGYYLLLVTTTEGNSKVYKPVSIFVQVKNEKIRVYAGGAEITNTLAVAMKSETAPKITKDVKDDTGIGATWKTAAAAGVGEVVDFSIKLEIPAYKGVQDLTLALTDTMEGLEYIPDSVKVYATRTAAAFSDERTGVVTEVVTDGYDAAAGKQTVKFVLDYDALNPLDAKGARPANSVSVYITYQAKMMKEVVATDKIHTETPETTYNYAVNKAVLEYATSLAPEDVKTSEEQSTRVYTYALSIDKRADETETEDAGSPLKKLNGAEFTIYRDYDAAAKTLGEAIEFVAVTNDAGEVLYYRPATDADTAGKLTAIPANNSLLVKGLDLGIYYVSETKVPSGYYAPNGGFKLELIGDRTAGDNTINGVLLNSSSAVALEDADHVLLAGAAINTIEVNRFDIVMKNSSTPILPTTGGMGTALFTVGGVLLMAVAAWLFFFRKGKKEN